MANRLQEARSALHNSMRAQAVDRAARTIHSHGFRPAPPSLPAGTYTGNYAALGLRTTDPSAAAQLWESRHPDAVNKGNLPSWVSNALSGSGAPGFPSALAGRPGYHPVMPGDVVGGRGIDRGFGPGGAVSSSGDPFAAGPGGAITPGGAQLGPGGQSTGIFNGLAPQPSGPVSNPMIPAGAAGAHHTEQMIPAGAHHTEQPPSFNPHELIHLGNGIYLHHPTGTIFGAGGATGAVGGGAMNAITNALHAVSGPAASQPVVGPARAV